jgi:hypothetical protein
MLHISTGQRRHMLGDPLVYRVGTYRQWATVVARQTCPQCGSALLVMGNRDRLDDTAAPALHACTGGRTV